MSPLPPISPRDLRDHADPERVERIWARVQTNLPNSRSSREFSRPLVWAGSLSAAAAAVFGLGFLAGSREVPPLETAVRPEASGTSVLEVFASGTSPRSYRLPGGGTLELQPDTLMETASLDDSGLTLTLVRGSASVDSATLAVTVVAGEARVLAPAGSAVALARRSAGIDVTVQHGSAEVTSPLGRQVVARGQSLAHVPTMIAIASIPSDRTAPEAAEPTVERPRVQPNTPSLGPNVGIEKAPAPSVEVAPAPSWVALASSAKFEEAFEVLESGAGLEGSLKSAQGARELYLLADVAASKKMFDVQLRALRRIADEFGSDPNAVAAAMQLSLLYASTDRALAAKYRDIAKQASAFAEPALCAELSQLIRDEVNSDAVKKASEYLTQFPNGSCSDDARDVLATASAISPQAKSSGREEERPADKKEVDSSPDAPKDGTVTEPKPAAAPSVSGSVAPKVVPPATR